MASPTQGTWVWACSSRWWRTGEPGVMQSMGLQRVGHDWVNNNTIYVYIHIYVYTIRVFVYIHTPRDMYIHIPGIESRSPALQVDSLPAEPQGKHVYIHTHTHTHTLTHTLTHIVIYIYIHVCVYILSNDLKYRVLWGFCFSLTSLMSSAFVFTLHFQFTFATWCLKSTLLATNQHCYLSLYCSKPICFQCYKSSVLNPYYDDQTWKRSWITFVPLSPCI